METDFLGKFIDRTERDMREMKREMTAGFLKVEKKIDSLTSFKWKAIGVVAGVSATCSVIVTIITLILKFK